MSTDEGWAAVVLTGGTSTRLGGADKAGLARAGRSLLDSALDAVAGAAEVVVVGPETAVGREVRFAREEPAGGGPLAGVGAGVAALSGEPAYVVVLAVDMPGVSADTVDRLLAAAAGRDGAWLVDPGGRRQLAGVVRRGLVPAPEEAAGRPMRDLMDRPGCADVPAGAGEAEDVDTWEDAARLGIERDTSHRT